MDNVISRKAFAERMREISKTMKPSEIEGADGSDVMRVSFELWSQLADMIESGVEVVRCKDCNHSSMNGGDCERTITITKRDHVLELNVSDYIKLEFCSYGERKDVLDAD